jgi:hypothetical protein
MAETARNWVTTARQSGYMPGGIRGRVIAGDHGLPWTEMKRDHGG